MFDETIQVENIVTKRTRDASNDKVQRFNREQHREQEEEEDSTKVAGSLMKSRTIQHSEESDDSLLNIQQETAAG